MVVVGPQKVSPFQFEFLGSKTAAKLKSRNVVTGITFLVGLFKIQFTRSLRQDGREITMIPDKKAPLFARVNGSYLDDPS